MLRKCVATQGNKWQQKRLKTHNRKTLNVYHVLMAGTQGVKQKVKKSSLDVLKRSVFIGGLK
jgi:hypothetical protein